MCVILSELLYCINLFPQLITGPKSVNSFIFPYLRHSRYYDDRYIDSTAYYDTFFHTLPIQSSSKKLSYIDSPDITIQFQSPSHIVITRVYCIYNIFKC